VLDLVEAVSEREVRAAAARLAGGLGALLEDLHQPLLALSALLEGALEFPDEAGEIEDEAAAAVSAALLRARSLEAGARRGRRLHQGSTVVLFGPVNAGKSTLFNRLVGGRRALVDAEPGTTRDALEARVELQGQLVCLFDTAGLREAPGRLEALGIGRTRELLAVADLAVLVVPPGSLGSELAQWRGEVGDARRLDVQGKADLAGAQDLTVQVSGVTGAGVERLVEVIMARLEPDHEGLVLATDRHLDGLMAICHALVRAEDALTTASLEVVAGEVSVALRELGALTGHDVSSERLDALFARFCVGK